MSYLKIATIQKLCSKKLLNNNLSENEFKKFLLSDFIPFKQIRTHG